MLNVLSLFSGIGAFEKALERERVLFKVMNFCEIDKYASKSYCAIHGVSEQINLRDVSSVNTAELHDVNLITYGFPCQDISSAGHQKGFFDENGNITGFKGFLNGCENKICFVNKRQKKALIAVRFDGKLHKANISFDFPDEE